MIQVHRSTLVLLVTASFITGVAVAWYRTNAEMIRIREERDVYRLMSVTALDTSNKALLFVESCQSTLDACINRFVYSNPFREEPHAARNGRR